MGFILVSMLMRRAHFLDLFQDVGQEPKILRSTYYKWSKTYEEEGIEDFKKVRLKRRI